jgi:hypothetical protein
MASFSEPLYITYSFPAVTFVGGGTVDIKGPPGMRGRVQNALLNQVSVAFTNTTTSGKLRVGDTVTAAKHLDLDLGTTAIGAVASGLGVKS